MTIDDVIGSTDFFDHTAYRHSFDMPEGYEAEQIRWATAYVFLTPAAENMIVIDDDSGCIVFFHSHISPEVIGDNPKLMRFNASGPHKGCIRDDDGEEGDVPPELRGLLDMMRTSGADELAGMLESGADTQGDKLNDWVYGYLKRTHDTEFSRNNSPFGIFNLPIPNEVIDTEWLDFIKSQLAVSELIPVGLTESLDKE